MGNHQTESTRNARNAPIAPSSIGAHSRYIGRVGALAVALGIGVAVATSPGVAWADDASGGGESATTGSGTTTTGGTGSDKTAGVGSNSGGTSGDAAGKNGTGGNPGNGAPGDVAGNTGGATTVIGPSTTTLGGWRSPRATISASTVDTSVRTKGDAKIVDGLKPKGETDTTGHLDRGFMPASPEVTRQLSKRPAGKSMPPQILDYRRVYTPAGPAGADAAQKQVQSLVKSNVVTNNPPVSAQISNLTTMRPTQLSVAARLTADVTEVDPSPSEPAPKPIQRLVAIPAQLITAGMNFVVGLFEPIVGPGGTLDSPLLWGLLEAARRETNRTLNNHTPTLALQQLSGQDLDDRQIHGTLGGFDADGDALTYSVAAVGAGAPTHGNVTIDAAAGTWTYTPATGYSGTDTFTITADDSGAGWHLHGVGQAHSTSDSITVIVSPGAPTGQAPGVLESSFDVFPVTTAGHGPQVLVTDSVVYVVGKNGWAVYDAATGNKVADFVRSSPNDYFFSDAVADPDGRIYAPGVRDTASGGQELGVDVFDALTGALTGFLPGATIAYEPEPVGVAYGEANSYAKGFPFGTVVVASREPAALVGTLSLEGQILDMALSPDGQRLYVLMNERTSYRVDVVKLATADAPDPTAYAAFVPPSPGSIPNSVPTTKLPSPAAFQPPNYATGQVGGRIVAPAAPDSTTTYAGSIAGPLGALTVNPDGSFVFTPTPEARDLAKQYPKASSVLVFIKATDGQGTTTAIPVSIPLIPAGLSPSGETDPMRWDDFMKQEGAGSPSRYNLSDLIDISVREVKPDPFLPENQHALQWKYQVQNWTLKPDIPQMLDPKTGAMVTPDIYVVSALHAANDTLHNGNPLVLGYRKMVVGDDITIKYDYPQEPDAYVTYWVAAFLPGTFPEDEFKTRDARVGGYIFDNEIPAEVYHSWQYYTGYEELEGAIEEVKAAYEREHGALKVTAQTAKDFGETFYTFARPDGGVVLKFVIRNGDVFDLVGDPEDWPSGEQMLLVQGGNPDFTGVPPRIGFE